MEQKKIKVFTLKQNTKMFPFEFYEKWNINKFNSTYYKKKFPQFVENNLMNYSKLDKEFQRRINIKENAKQLLFEAKAKDIEDCFACKENKVTAHNWLTDLYMPYLQEKRNQNLISDRAIRRIELIVKHYKLNKK